MCVWCTSHINTTMVKLRRRLFGFWSAFGHLKLWNDMKLWFLHPSHICMCCSRRDVVSFNTSSHLLVSFADLSTAQRKFAESLNEFKFQCIGDAETDDEICIGESARCYPRAFSFYRLLIIYLELCRRFSTDSLPAKCSSCTTHNHSQMTKHTI